ncbi:dTDP-4-dehydrorhamnose reductase [Gulosibacter bifidus]|uniref:dTDP-4-dehydrorhamnose reductase n=1 Tax=Gulosibacter bifidus TaxID=272239 RepID=A0ABW5RHM1_9MICO|nr:dTDP-4-dehydrorhamnose reductase [Gulosibacter bifidus]
MTRYAITGAAGMLGQDLQQALAGREVTAFTRHDLDITDAAATAETLKGFDVIINAAAYTAVDDAETNEDAALAINGTGVANLAAAAAATGAKFVHVSTDYVFKGDATEPYGENDPRDPINAYGRTKAAGEVAALAAHPTGTYIVRTAWLYGAGGPNFAKTMVKLAGTHPEITVVNDQLGQPTYTRDLASQIVKLVDADAPAGIYHGTNSGTATWFDFAREIFRLSGNDPERVKPTDSTAFKRPAARPAFSVLGHDAWTAAGIEPMRPWLEALEQAAEDGVLAV